MWAPPASSYPSERINGAGAGTGESGEHPELLHSPSQGPFAGAQCAGVEFAQPQCNPNYADAYSGFAPSMHQGQSSGVHSLGAQPMHMPSWPGSALAGPTRMSCEQQRWAQPMEQSGLWNAYGVPESPDGGGHYGRPQGMMHPQSISNSPYGAQGDPILGGQLGGHCANGGWRMPPCQSGGHGMPGSMQQCYPAYMGGHDGMSMHPISGMTEAGQNYAAPRYALPIAMVTAID
ncbi:hypothetical protein T492DRAFT_872775 [Pavlovales sp. CCMP2436]|nr:hypothetical protein T492DRAFT_872775 [Pavlovales sp. CCMP2436]